MDIQLYPHQQALVDRNPAKHLLAFDTGTGKTYTAMALAHKNNVQSVLVIVPKSILGKWCGDIQAFHASGTVEKVHASYSRVRTGIGPDSRIYHVVTKEYHRDARKKNTLDYLRFIKAEAYIVDEAHYFAGITSAMSKCLNYDIQVNKPKYTWLLSATPYLSTPWNIYTLGRLLGNEWDYAKFRAIMFFQMRIGTKVIWQPRPNAKELLQPYVAKISTRIGIEEVIDIPDQVDVMEYVTRTQEQEKAVREDDATDHIVMWTRKHQIDNGYIPAVPLAGRPMQYVFDNKLPYVLAYVREHEGRCAIICRYTAQIELYEQALIKEGYEVHKLTGDTKDRDGVIQSAKEGGVFLAQASISEGYELPSIEHVLFASLSFSYKDYKQMRGRFLRINAPTPTEYVHLMIKNGIDRDVYNSILEKKDFNVNMYA